MFPAQKRNEQPDAAHRKQEKTGVQKTKRLLQGTISVRRDADGAVKRQADGTKRSDAGEIGQAFYRRRLCVLCPVVGIESKA